MKDFFQHIGGHFRRNRQELPDEVVAEFLRVLEEARVQDMPCEQVFSRLDEYVEKKMHGEDVEQVMPLLREHFDLCPDCCAEYEALLNMMEKSAKDQQSGRK